MYILYYKELHIVKDPMRQNCTCQTYRNKQLAMCEDIKPLVKNTHQSKKTKADILLKNSPKDNKPSRAVKLGRFYI